MMFPPLSETARLVQAEKSPFQPLHVDEATLAPGYTPIVLPPSRWASATPDTLNENKLRLPPPNAKLRDLIPMSSDFSTETFNSTYKDFIRTQKAGAHLNVRRESGELKADFTTKPLDWVPFISNNQNSSDWMRERAATTTGEIMSQNPVGVAQLYSSALTSKEFAEQLCKGSRGCNQASTLLYLSSLMCSSLSQFDNLLDQAESIQQALFISSMVIGMIPLGGMAISAGGGLILRAMTAMLFKKMATKFGADVLAKAVAGSEVGAAFKIVTGTAQTYSTGSMLSYLAYTRADIYERKENQMNALLALASSQPGNDAVLQQITQVAKDLYDINMDMAANGGALAAGALMLPVFNSLKLVSSVEGRAQLLVQLQKAKNAFKEIKIERPQIPLTRNGSAGPAGIR